MSGWDAIVVGAGPAGAATAFHLSQGGAQVLLLDRARFPRDKPCSEYLSPETTRLLGRLGPDVLPAVERTAHARLYGMKVFAPNGAVMRGRFAAAHGYPCPRPYSFALPRMVFDRILLDAAARAGAVVREQAAVEDLTFEGDMVSGVRVRTGGGRREELKARIIVGADGLHSVVARRLRLARHGLPQRIAFTAHVSDVAGVDDYGELHVGDSGYVGLGPIGGGLTTVALVLPRKTVHHRGAAIRAEFFAELERFPALRGRFDPERLERAVLVTGPFARTTRRSADGGALLVGDAADFFDPFTGQGIYSALAGAELAAATVLPLLARGVPLTRAALAPYRAARRAAFQSKWILERLIGLGVGSPGLTNRVVARLARRPDLADLLVGATGNYVPARRVLAPEFLTRLVW